MSGTQQRREQIAASLAAVHRRIDDACARVGRDPAGVTTVVVTKTFPTSDIRLLARLGIGDVGENRDQEGSAKFAELRDDAASQHQCVDAVGRPLTWHFIGRLQTNKAKSVAAWADTVHSVDSVRLVNALTAGIRRLHERGVSKDLGALVQVSLDGDLSRGGAPADQVPAIADAIAAAAGLELRGVMAVAPLGVDPDRAFAALAQLAATIRTNHPDASWISAGMSGDLEDALVNGATHLRVGGAVLGNRPPLA